MINIDRSSIIRLLYEYIDREDWASLATLFHDTITYERPGYPKLCGVDSVLEFYGKSRLILKGIHDVITVVESGSMIAVCGRFRGTSRDLRNLNFEYSDFFNLESNVIKYRKTYFHVPYI